MAAECNIGRGLHGHDPDNATAIVGVTEQQVHNGSFFGFCQGQTREQRRDMPATLKREKHPSEITDGKRQHNARTYQGHAPHGKRNEQCEGNRRNLQFKRVLAAVTVHKARDAT